MGARAGRKGARTYNILTYGAGWWRKYLDKKRRKSAKQAAIKEQISFLASHPWGDKAYDVECICGQIFRNPDTCRCGCGVCCNEENRER